MFYTPDRLSTALAAWAIRRPSDLVLEPGFGGCGLLEAAVERLQELGARSAKAKVFGCDVDQTAFKHLREAFGTVPVRNFLKADFLTLRPRDFARAHFDVILSNPPYVSHHNMFGVQRKTAFAFSQMSGFPGGKRASLWAYFVWQGLQFLRPGGRAAWVLPGSLLNTDYSKALLMALRTRFRRVSVASISERLFLADGTDESTEVLLAEDYGATPSAEHITIEWCDSVDHCARLLTEWDQFDTWQQPLDGRSKGMLVGEDCSQLVRNVEREPCCKSLGDYARISIGIVTGANRYFVLNKTDVVDSGLQDHCFDYILSKFSIARGMQLSVQDLQNASDCGLRCYLLHTAGRELSAEVSNYLARFPTEVLASNRTFKKRPIWHQPDDGQIPDGFFPYMNHIGPRIVLNTAGVNSTNTVHRVYFNPIYGLEMRKLVAISLLSTFSHLSAEVEGRTYGSGVLKFEPTEARKIKLLIPAEIDFADAEVTYSVIDVALRNGNPTRARQLADDFLQHALPNIYTSERRATLSAALGELRRRRHTTKSNAESEQQTA